MFITLLIKVVRFFSGIAMLAWPIAAFVTPFMLDSPKTTENPLIISLIFLVLGYPFVFYGTAKTYKQHLELGNSRSALKVAAIPLAVLALVAGIFLLTFNN